MAAPSISTADRSVLGSYLLRRGTEVLGVGLIVLALALLVALWGHDANDPSLNRAAPGPANNPLGWWGASLSNLSLEVFGIASWIVVLVLPFWGLRLILGRPMDWFWIAVAALPVALLAAAAFLATVAIPESWPYFVGLGGWVGDFMMQRLERPFGAGTYAATTGVVAMLAFLLSLGVTWREAWQGLRWLISLPFRSGTARQSEPAPVRPRWDQAMEQRFGTQPPSRRTLGERLGALTGFIGRPFARRGRAPAPDVPPGRRPPIFPDAADVDETAVASRRRRAPKTGGPEADELPLATPPKKTDAAVPPADDAPSAVVAEGADELVPEPAFELPPLRFLAQARRTKVTIDRGALAETARALEKVLDDFGVRGEIVDVRPGPVVTLYELEPAPGTRAARVISLADDIARSLCAMSVRVATVPGRNVIGIELPNDSRETVYLRDLLASSAYEDTAAKLCLALGKDIGGEPQVCDLSRMPHLLIAGTTGSGKSVAINAMILSLLYRLPPAQLKFIMIDPKVIELSVYDGIPHLLAPVVTEPAKAVVALKWVVREMDERYRLMSHLGVRDIATFNRRMAEAMDRGEKLSRKVQTGFEPGTGVPVFEQQPIEMAQMPLICVVVDEVADLMLTAGKEIESAIQRLSQKARAAGIHLIVATQRPSVDVLTGVIKANLPSRISFRVSSKIDSRTILGEPGAEQLLGQGDMLFMMPGERINRIHGPLVTEEEVEQVVNYLRDQGEPDYIDAVTDEAALDGGGAVGAALGEPAGGEEGQYQQAVQIVAREGKASTSFLQRKMRIGYNSAARLIERMEDEGMISHPDHVGRRRVLINETQDG